MRKRMICGCLATLLLVMLSACGSQPNAPSEPADIQQDEPITQVDKSNALYGKAMEILDEFDDPCIEDFKEAYFMLMSMPSDKDDFIDQIYKVNQIFERNNVKFQYGGWYTQPYLSDESITQDGIDGYKNEQVFYDIRAFLETCIYPLIFEKYGTDAWCINGIIASGVISAIEADIEYSHGDTTESSFTCTEEWLYNGAPTNMNYQFKVTYHKNGLVQHINIPIVRSNQPMDDAVLGSYFDFEPSEQKKIAENRFTSLLEQMDVGMVGYDVLHQIYSDEEIGVICSFLKSLPSVIWERNIYTEAEAEAASYTGATIQFRYKGNSIIASFGLNSIELQISGGNYVNQLSHKWNTVYCGFGYSNDADISLYQDNIDYNLSANTELSESVFDLDAHEQEYIGEYPLNGNSEGNETTSPETFILSMSDTVTVEGALEKNTDAFPMYRFKLDAPIHIVLKEYEEEFTCEYLYFYDDAELNGGFDYSALIGRKCSVTASVENYRGGGNIFFLFPEITPLS